MELSAGTMDMIREIVKGELSRLEGKINQRMDQLEEKMGDMNGKLEGIVADVDGLSGRVTVVESRTDSTEGLAVDMSEVLRESVKRQEEMQWKLIDLESRSRRNNLRVFGVPEGAEGESMMQFLEKFIKEELKVPQGTELKIQRAHRSLAAKPPPSAPPRAIIINFLEYDTKEKVLKEAWAKGGKILINGKPIYFDHDYASEIIKIRKQYIVIKKALKAAKIRFQTPYTRMRIFWENERVQTYNTAAEAYLALKRKGIPVERMEEAERDARPEPERPGVTPPTDEARGQQEQGGRPAGERRAAADEARVKMKQLLSVRAGRNR